MTEVTRFRIARAPVMYDGSGLDAIRYPAHGDASHFPCREPGGDALPLIGPFLKSPAYVAAPVDTEPTCQSVPEEQLDPVHALLLTMARFTAWLDAAAGRREPPACKEWLGSQLGRIASLADPHADLPTALVASEPWRALRVLVGDSVIAAVVTGLQAHASYLTRLFRAISVVELLRRDADAASIAHTATRSLLVLPPWIVRVRSRYRGDRGAPLFARQPAFSDLIVVREEWSCYVPGEIAHIETIMSGELKERVHRRLDETENKQQTDTTRATYEERDTQSTERTSLKEESQNQTHFQVGVDGQVDTSGQYGPTHVDTHLGAQLSYSADASRTRANEQSKEIISRAVSKVETNVHELRSTRTLNRIVELNRHKFDNTSRPSEHVNGIYRWVDRIVRLQTFRYRHRFLLEFEVPEPAAYIRWTRRNAPDPDVLRPVPSPFESAPGVPLTPADVTRDSYQAYVGRFGAAGVLPPPDPQVSVSVADSLTADGPPVGRENAIDYAPTMHAKLEITVPQSYKALSALASLSAAPTLARWRDQPDQSRDGYIGAALDSALGYHNVTAAINLGGEVLRLRSSASPFTVLGDVHDRGPGLPEQLHMQYTDAWTTVHANVPVPPSGSFGSGKLEAAVLVGGCYQAAVSVNVLCVLDPSAYEAWQNETFDRLYEAYRTVADAYREAWTAAKVQHSQSVFERSPIQNAETVREELKRQVIELLLKQKLQGFNLKDSDAVQGQVTRLAESLQVAPLIQFVEQAFEWSNMTYIVYPYYWADENAWQELQNLDGPDADFERFLRSGSARVVVPARPGFEHAVMYFANFGEPWLGEAPPIPGDNLYVSVAQEIEEMRGAPDDGEPGDLWEERLPTTLVWLDPDASLPKRNDHRRLVGTPLIDLCGP